MCKRVSEWNEFWLPIFNFEPDTSSSHVQKNVGMEFEHHMQDNLLDLIIGGAAPAVGEWMRHPLHHRCWPELLSHTRFDGSINDAYQLVSAATFDLASSMSYSTYSTCWIWHLGWILDPATCSYHLLAFPQDLISISTFSFISVHSAQDGYS